MCSIRQQSSHSFWRLQPFRTMGAGRSMVRGGFARNGPASKRFTLSNASILTVRNTRLASSFCQQQHLAHMCRMENNALQKQLLFAMPRKKEVSHCKQLANDYKIDESQLWRTLFDKKAVNELLQATHGECYRGYASPTTWMNEWMNGAALQLDWLMPDDYGTAALW